MNKKPFLTIQDSIDRMANEKKISFKNLDDNYAYDKLKLYSLNKLYTPYKKVLNLKKNSSNKHVYSNIHFKDFEILYNLDVECSKSALSTLLTLEVKLKTALINAFGDFLIIENNYIDREFNTLDVLNYLYTNTNVNNKSQLIKMLKSWISTHTHNSYNIEHVINIDTGIIEVDNSCFDHFKDKELKHHYTKYNCVPFWLFVNKMTLGNITTILKYTKNEIIINAAEYMNISTNNFKRKSYLRMIDDLRKYRNILSHGYTLATVMDTNIREVEAEKFYEMVGYLSKEELSTLEYKFKKTINRREHNKTIKKISKNCNNTILNEIICKVKKKHFWSI